MKKHLISLCLWLSAISWLSGQITLSGTVTDEKGEALIGATILEIGTLNGAVTDIVGEFELEIASDSAQILISYTGYIPQRLLVGEATTLTIILRTFSETLEEVLVIGYGTTSKRNQTDNVAKLTSKEFTGVPIPSIQGAIAGKAAGVRVTQLNGKVESGINIQVRGIASVSAQSEPLYILDGVPLIRDNVSTVAAISNPLLFLNPREIESIDILKDASSAAIYGSRGANGVVLITTKGGQKGPSKVTFNFSRGMSEPTNLVEFLNAEEYVTLLTEAADNTDELGNLTTNFNRISGGTDWQNGEVDTDWNDVIFRTGTQTDLDLSFSGGNDQTTFYFGGGYNETRGILLGNALDRFNGRVKVKHKFSKLLNAGINLGFSRTNMNRLENDDSGVTPMASVSQAPISPARLPDGTPYNQTLFENYLFAYENIRDATLLNRVTGKVFAELRLAKTLTFNADFGYDLSYQTEDYFASSAFTGPRHKGFAFASTATTENYVLSNYLTFAREFGAIHDLKVVMGMEFNDADRSYRSVSGENFPSDDFQNLNSAARITSGEGFFTQYNFLSYFARASYVLNNRYFLKGSIRRDGSSRFGTDQRFGTFPAGSIGWIISEENFLQNLPFSFLKLRASYGELGNAEIGNFPFQSLYIGISYADFPGVAPLQPNNEELTWEKTQQLNLGIEFGLFNNALTGEIDYYQKTTDELLLRAPLPPSSGAPFVNRNVGKLESEGIELILNTVVNVHNDLLWKTSFNLARNINEIINLPNDGADILVAENILREGETVNAFYLPEYAGVDPANGDALWYINDESSGRATTNDIANAQPIVVGNPYPDWIGGLTNTVMFKGVDLSLTFMGEWGASIYNAAGFYQSSNASQGLDNQTRDQINRWQQPGDITNIPQARLEGFNGTQASTRWLEEADFIRLRNLTIGYSFPERWLAPSGLQKLRVYLAGINLWTITSYSGYDPESRSDAGRGAGGIFGIANFTSPAARTVSFGLNVTF